MSLLSSLKSYGYLILSGLVGFLALLLKLSRMESKSLEKQRDTYKAGFEKQQNIAIKQKEIQQDYRQRLVEATKDEKAMDDRLSGDNWSMSDDTDRSS